MTLHQRLEDLRQEYKDKPWKREWIVNHVKMLKKSYSYYEDRKPRLEKEVQETLL